MRPIPIPRSSDRIALLERKLARAETARAEAERLLEERARVLDRLNLDLRKRESELLASLQLKNELLLRAQRIARIATMHEEADGTLLCSREFGRIVGLPEQEQPSREAIMRVIDPLDRARVVRAQQHFVSDHPADVDFTVDNRVIGADHQKRWLRWTFRRTQTPGGEWTILGTVQDITRQRASERRAAALNLIAHRQLRRLQSLAADANEARRLRERAVSFLEVVLNTVPQGIAVFDSDLRLALWNRRLPVLTEIDAYELSRGMPFQSFADRHWRHDPQMRGDRLARDHEGRVVAQRFERTLSDGRTVEVEVRLLADGGMVKTYADVTPLKRSEEHLRSQGQELADRIIELERTSSELRQSQQEAENANRSKSQFLAMMSHDIRTPLNGVLGMLSMLALTRLDDAQREQVALARTAGDQLRVLLDDVVEIVRAEAGKLDLTPTPINLRSTFEGIVAFWRATLIGDGLTIEHLIDPSLPDRISIDPTRLRQLFDNLISNALKYTGIGRVSVRAMRSGASLRIEVEDSGPGIAREQQAVLFTDFGRLRTTSPGHTPGAGLGLAICQRIVVAMGGSIGVDSEIGSGSCFWFELPLVEVVEPVDPIAAPEQAVVKTRDGRRPRVLIAEDIETNRVVLAMMLHLIGCDHEAVCDGQSAVEAVTNGSFDLVLMDVQMPGMNGTEATRAIRAMPDARRNIPIVGVTAHALHSERAALIAAGMTACLSKPIQRSLLTTTLRAVFDANPAEIETTVLEKTTVDQLIAALGSERAAAIVDLALRDIEALRDRLKTAQSSGDDEDARRARHSLRGVASNIGASDLMRAIAEDVATDLEKLDRVIALTNAAVRTHLAPLLAAQ